MWGVRESCGKPQPVKSRDLWKGATCGKIGTRMRRSAFWLLLAILLPCGSSVYAQDPDKDLEFKKQDMEKALKDLLYAKLGTVSHRIDGRK